jgi:magnesium transporter
MPFGEGCIMPELMEQDASQANIQRVTQALESGHFVYVRKLLQNLPAYDIALLLESTPAKNRSIVWQLIDHDAQGEVLEELSEEVRKGILKNMDANALITATEGMDVDDIAEVLRTLPDHAYQQVISALDHQNRARIEKALSYDEETAAGIMNTDTITLRADVTVDVVLRYLRLKKQLPEATDSFYVVDDNDKFVGAVSLADIVTAQPETLIGDIIDKDIEAIPAHMPDVEVAQKFERHDWLSAPVVDEEGHLLGRITIDDVIDIIREDAEHSMMSMAGLDDEADTFAPVIKSAQQRAIWLGVNLLTAMLAVAVSSLFEPVLSQLAILAILNSLVPSMGGVAASQTLTLVIRGLALGHIVESNQRKLLLKELAVGLINGIVWALLIATIVALWKDSWMLGGIIAFAMLVNLTAAGIAGVLVPIGLKKLNIDPALAGGVVVTTVTDVVGIFSFLGTATWLLMPAS